MFYHLNYLVANMVSKRAKNLNYDMYNKRFLLYQRHLNWHHVHVGSKKKEKKKPHTLLLNICVT